MTQNLPHREEAFAVLDEDFRLLISGQSGCGKTNTVMHICGKLLFIMTKFTFSPQINTRTKLLTSKK